jgi:polyisoprenoid-binding protein YceI
MRGTMKFRMSRLAMLVIAVSGLAARPALRGADTFQVDSVHSTMVFKVKHLGASNFYGRFNDISGKLVLDAGDAKKSSVAIDVKTESVDTGNSKRDQHLKGPDFFAAKEFAAISFKSTEVKKAGEGELEVKGQLTLHGVTKDLTVKVTQTGTGKDPFNPAGKRAGFETTFKIKRSDFGMKNMLDALGDEVEITVSVECTNK